MERMDNLEQTVIIKDLVRRSDETAESNFTEFEEEFNSVKELGTGSLDVLCQEAEISIDYNNSVEAIELNEINDKHGRLSDALESLEISTGFSVLPIALAHIASEVKTLARHEIFEFQGVRYSMSPNIRKAEIERMEADILKTIQDGVVFRESLMTTFAYKGKIYSTLLLSRVEWDWILSRFKLYKHSLRVINNSDIILIVEPERIGE